MILRLTALLIILFFSAWISGCVHLTQDFTKPSGELARCETTGWGWIGTPLALVQHSQCEKEKVTLGYAKVEK